MNILIVSQYFYPENFRINDLANELKNRGHKIVVLTGTPNYLMENFSMDRVFLRRQKKIIMVSILLDLH